MDTTNRLTKSEIQGLLKILQSNVKTAKAAIMGRGADLKAAFEIQLDTTYPPSGDAVWNSEFNAAVKACEPYARRIEERCNELGIGTRFRPKLNPPTWSYGGEQLFKEIRNDRRRVAHAQIEAKLRSDVEEMERKSNTAQLEIISNGFVTDAAKEFMLKLPTIDQLIPPLREEELAALIEGKALARPSLTDKLVSGQLEDRHE